MTILVTGSSGFLGRFFYQFNRFSAKKIVWGTTSQNKKEYILFKDCYQDIHSVLQNVPIDVIIHCACAIPSDFSKVSYEKHFLKNCDMMNNLYLFSMKNEVKQFIYLSSFGSMSNPEDLDIKDYYTLSKITGELFCKLFENHGCDTVSLRISAPYGEYSTSSSVINLFIKKALKNETIQVYGSGRREQNFTYAADVLTAVELAIQCKVKGRYNIVGDKNISMLDLARLIKEITNSNSDIVVGQFNDPQEDYKPSYSYARAKKDMGYSPKFSLKEGLIRYINWITKHENRHHF